MSKKPPLVLIQIGCHLRQDQADESGLVLLSQEIPYWVFETDGLFGLYVEGANAEAATLELERFETERETERELLREALEQQHPQAPPRKINPFSLHVFVWTMCLFYGLQMLMGKQWMDRGMADSEAILRGQVWRTVTALTLHADFGHLFANVCTGLIFAWALLPLLGSGWTWLGLLLSGGLGNLLNALGHQGEPHYSIGASTAVFGGLGLLVGWQVIAVIQHHQGRRGHPLKIRDIALPFAAGLALLAYLGAGGGDGSHNVDIPAHAFGMAAGLLLGIIFAWARLPEKTPERAQRLLAITALFLPLLAWAALLSY